MHPTTRPDPMPAVETLRDRSRGKPIVSHLYWEQIARVLLARRLNDHYGYPIGGQYAPA